MPPKFIMSTKILCVDDEENVLTGLQRTLRKQFPIDIAVGGAAGLQRLERDGPYAVVMADMQMPEMNGIEFLKKAQAAAPDTVRLMLTGNADQKTAVDAVNDGHVFRFLTKPCEPPALTSALEAALRQYRLITAERELLENTLGGAVQVLTEILSATDPATFQRSQRLKEYVQAFGQASSMKTVWELELAAMLSQIGRVTIPATLLAKERAGLSLTGPEMDVLNRVPEVGARLLEKIPRLENVVAFVRYQQKHFDGSGSPSDSVAAGAIPIGARILKVLGDLIAIETKSVSKAAAFQRLQERKGWYDPEVLAAASRCFDVWLGVPDEKRPPSEPMRIEDLRTSHVLAQDIRTKDGSLIMAADTKLSPTILEKLVNFKALGTIDGTILVHVE